MYRLRQSTNPTFISTEKAGKTLHLLKSNSKPTKPRQKRKKVELFGTFDQYQESKKKPQPVSQQDQKLIADVLMMAPHPNPNPQGKKEGKKEK